MGRHNRPGDPAQDDVVTEELPAVVSDPTPPVSGRHRGDERETWADRRARRRTRQPEHGTRMARSHRPAPVALHVTVGAITAFALMTSWGVATVRSELDTVRPDPAPLQGQFASVPSPATGSAPVTSAPVARKTGRAATPSGPVTRRTPEPVTSKSPRGGTPDRPRRSGSPSSHPSPGGGGPTSSSPAPADPTTAPPPVLDLPDLDCPWRQG